MILVKSILRVNFDEATRPWMELRELMRTAASDPKIEMQAAPIVLERKDERVRIVLQIRGVALEHETAGPLSKAITDAQSIMARLNEASAFPEVRSVRYDVIFIEPFSLPFHELVEYMKGKFLKPTRIANVSSDIGLIFDQRDNDLLKHVTLGPMDRTQLMSQYLKWTKEDEIPDTFVYLNLGYESTEKAPFSEEALAAFLNEAAEWQESEANSLVGELKEGGD